MFYQLFTTIFILPYLLFHLGNTPLREISLPVPEIRFDKDHSILVNKLDRFRVLYPKTLKAHYFLFTHSTTFEDKNAEGFGLMGIYVKDTDLPDGNSWIQTENRKRTNEPPIKISEVKNYNFGTLFFLRTPEVIDFYKEEPVYGDRISAILIKDHKLYTFWTRSYDVKGSGPDKDFLEMVENFLPQ